MRWSSETREKVRSQLENCRDWAVPASPTREQSSGLNEAAPLNDQWYQRCCGCLPSHSGSAEGWPGLPRPA